MLDLNVAEVPGGLLVSVGGEVDMDSSPQLLVALRAALRASGAVKVSLARVGYIDSSGIAVLIQGFKLARKAAKAFVLVDPSPRVLSVLELSQLRGFFPIEGGGAVGIHGGNA